MEKKQQILVVDNDPAFITVVKELLSCNYEVVTASTKQEAWNKLRMEVSNLIIIGYLNPRGESFKFHIEIRTNPLTVNTPLLIVDVRPEEHLRKGWTRDEGMQMDAEDYLSRPVSANELKKTIANILARQNDSPLELSGVLAQMEEALNRMDEIERFLVK